MEEKSPAGEGTAAMRIIKALKGLSSKLKNPTTLESFTRRGLRQDSVYQELLRMDTFITRATIEEKPLSSFSLRGDKASS